MFLIDGRKISNEIRCEIKKEVALIKEKTNLSPCLSTILIGDNPASQTYINAKLKACKDAGIKSLHFNLIASSSKEEIISLIRELNDNPEVDGILLQLPLPNNDYAKDCLEAISPLKDVDGLHPYNAGMLSVLKDWKQIQENNLLISCTPLGIIHLLKKSNIEIAGKTALVIGRSNLLGKPLSMLLLANDATVIMAHSKTRDIKALAKSADILIAAVGKAKFINREFIKEGAVVIDAGINRTADGLKGDVDFEDAKDMNIWLTPVPGGVGPLTIACLLENTLKAFKNRKALKQ
jgi:methylenetetrahydrofolate dehydrogenase (NADP+)/methenyltetrahydrofolate cyclohydrolase